MKAAKEKKCFKCKKTKPLGGFYKHSQMADGRVNKCKACNKKDVRENRKSKIDYYRAYDTKRGNRQTPEYLKQYRKKNPNKYRAHRCVANAIKSGDLIKKPCEACGAIENIHGHHDDYSVALEVRWLCSAHHNEWHKKNGEGLNP